MMKIFKILSVILLSLSNPAFAEINTGKYEVNDLSANVRTINILPNKMLTLTTRSNETTKPVPYEINGNKIQFPFKAFTAEGFYRNDQNTIFLLGNSYKTGSLSFDTSPEIKDPKMIKEAKEIIGQCLAKTAKTANDLGQCMVANGLFCCRK